jgi:hypothetical protein
LYEAWPKGRYLLCVDPCILLQVKMMLQNGKLHDHAVLDAMAVC